MMLINIYVSEIFSNLLTIFQEYLLSYEKFDDLRVTYEVFHNCTHYAMKIYLTNNEYTS
jgi:hypothetical protein